MRLGVLSPQIIQDIQDIFTGLYRITGLYRTYRVLQDFTGFTGCGKPGGTGGEALLFVGVELCC